MRALVLLFTALVVLGVEAVSQPGEVRMIEVTGEGAKFWPRWRGPSAQGYVAAGKYANWWSPTNNIKWKVPVASGNSSPIVWGDRIYLTTAQDDGAKLSLVAFNRADGKQIWQTFVPQ